jgi:protein MpaA
VCAAALCALASSIAAGSAAPAGAVRGRTVVFGHSVQGRALVARVLGADSAPRKVLLVGCIHGDECAGRAILSAAEHAPLTAAVQLWLVPTLNPDGEAAGSRQNAHGVDLNRNFAYRWRPRTAPGTTFYAGTGPLSEPESRFARRLISTLRPDITIWFHQSETSVDNSSGSTVIEARFARRVALPLRRLIRYPGSATTWQAHRFPKATSFVVELPPGWLSAKAARAYARAVLDLAKG